MTSPLFRISRHSLLALSFLTPLLATAAPRETLPVPRMATAATVGEPGRASGVLGTDRRVLRQRWADRYLGSLGADDVYATDWNGLPTWLVVTTQAGRGVGYRWLAEGSREFAGSVFTEMEKRGGATVADDGFTYICDPRQAPGLSFTGHSKYYPQGELRYEEDVSRPGLAWTSLAGDGRPSVGRTEALVKQVAAFSTPASSGSAYLQQWRATWQQNAKRSFMAECEAGEVDLEALPTRLGQPLAANEEEGWNKRDFEFQGVAFSSYFVELTQGRVSRVGFSTTMDRDALRYFKNKVAQQFGTYSRADIASHPDDQTQTLLYRWDQSPAGPVRFTLDYKHRAGLPGVVVVNAALP